MGGQSPWMRFFPSDWRADPALRMCSLSARGLWMEMLCLMHESEPRGHLLVRGKKITDQQLANLCGVTTKEIGALLDELEKSGVFSRLDDGTIVSRRMVRDTEKRVIDQANGKRGGNPKIAQGVEPGVNPPLNGQGNPHGSNPLPLPLPMPEARSQKRKKDGAHAPPEDPEKGLFDRGKQVLGEKSGGMIAKLLKAKGSVPLARAAIEQASTKQNPSEYVGAIIRGDEHRAKGIVEGDPWSGWVDPRL